MKKQSNLSRLLQIAGRHKYLLYASWMLSAPPTSSAISSFPERWTGSFVPTKRSWPPVWKKARRKQTPEHIRQASKKAAETSRFMFIGTQCDLWGRPDGTGHEKISRGKFPRLIFSLIPSLFERHISIGCADLI